MAEKFDVTARLAEGRPAVDSIQNHVWACHLLGYQNADLTLHASQMRDWYGTEEGLELRALDADCAALESAVAAVDSAAQVQHDQLGRLPDAWQGAGADASQDFLRRHEDASACAAAALRTAAEALPALRDNLWHIVDGKVATAVAIGARGERADWLAAAHTVVTGAGDRAVASELIDQQVKPFVDNDIRGEWLTAMRTATAALVASFDTAIAGLSAQPPAVFEVPGELGPSWTPPTPTTGAQATTPAPVPAPPIAAAPAAAIPTPAAWLPAPSVPAPFLPASAPTPPIEPAAITPAAAPPVMPSPGDLGGALPGIGSSLSGLGQQLADAIGGLFSSVNDTLPEPSGLDDQLAQGNPNDGLDEKPDDDEPDVSAEPDEDAPDGGQPAEETVDAVEPQPAQAPAPEGCPPQPDTEPPPAAPTPVPAPPPEAPPPPADPTVSTQTPCEIAADELPQAGE